MPAVVDAVWWVRMGDTQPHIFLFDFGEFLGFVWSLWDITLVSSGCSRGDVCLEPQLPPITMLAAAYHYIPEHRPIGSTNATPGG